MLLEKANGDTIFYKKCRSADEMVADCTFLAMTPIQVDFVKAYLRYHEEKISRGQNVSKITWTDFVSLLNVFGRSAISTNVSC